MSLSQIALRPKRPGEHTSAAPGSSPTFGPTTSGLIPVSPGPEGSTTAPGAGGSAPPFEQAMSSAAAHAARIPRPALTRRASTVLASFQSLELK
jgi:hypothetical protein